MEVTCRIKKPLEKLEKLCKALPEFVTGAASLIDSPEMLKIYNKANKEDQLPSLGQVADAGAKFLVSAANFRQDSYRKFAGKLPMIPGCGTVSEIITQFSQGANLCKIFPAKELGGPAFVKAIDPAIHKTISLVPTGGTNAGNIPDYVDAGILVFGGSFSMIEKAIMKRIVDEQKYNLLADELKKIKELIDERRYAKYHDIDFAQATVEQVSKITGRNFNLS
jgi:2-keto-3-deoxy-6-phosphogluconate aldolase